MIRFSTRGKKVLVCAGAGCKAWSSEVISRKLEKLKAFFGIQELEVCQVPCFNRCGGGATVKIGACQGVKKFRRPDEAVEFVLKDRAGAAMPWAGKTETFTQDENLRVA